MAYFVFDLDETLGNFFTPYWFLEDLRPENPELTNIKSRLDAAYQYFVRAVADAETSVNPLGIMRPGIIDIMRKLKELKDKGLVKSLLIYSNNSHLESLEFAGDVIQHVVGDASLFSDCIHWGRKGREVEYTKPVREGSARKTWDVLSKYIKEGPTSATEVTPEQVYFFDDQPHVLETELPPNHTVRMMEYEFKASAAHVGELYKSALVSAFDRNEYALITFLDSVYNNENFTTPPMTVLNRYVQSLILKTRGTVTRTTPAPQPDDSVVASIALLEKFEREATAVQNQEGGKRLRLRRTVRRKRLQQRKKQHGSRRR